MSEREVHRDGWELGSDLGEARGLYDPMRFVVRLHSDVHTDLSGLPPGVGSASKFNKRQALALSTYFHETLHWWQHVGSTVGLMLSLAYPAETHINYSSLKRCLELIGPVKSLKSYQTTNLGQLSDEADRQLNLVINNYYDIEFCRWLALIPEQAAQIIRGNPYFEPDGGLRSAVICGDLNRSKCLWINDFGRDDTKHRTAKRRYDPHPPSLNAP